MQRGSVMSQATTTRNLVFHSPEKIRSSGDVTICDVAAVAATMGLMLSELLNCLGFI